MSKTVQRLRLAGIAALTLTICLTIAFTAAGASEPSKAFHLSSISFGERKTMYFGLDSASYCTENSCSLLHLSDAQLLFNLLVDSTNECSSAIGKWSIAAQAIIAALVLWPLQILVLKLNVKSQLVSSIICLVLAMLLALVSLIVWNMKCIDGVSFIEESKTGGGYVLQCINFVLLIVSMILVVMYYIKAGSIPGDELVGNAGVMMSPAEGQPHLDYEQEGVPNPSYNPPAYEPPVYLPASHGEAHTDEPGAVHSADTVRVYIPAHAATEGVAYVR